MPTHGRIARFEHITHKGQRGGKPLRVLALYLETTKKRGKPDLYACPYAKTEDGSFICLCGSFEDAHEAPFHPHTKIGNVRKHMTSKHDLEAHLSKTEMKEDLPPDFIDFDAVSRALGYGPEVFRCEREEHDAGDDSEHDCGECEVDGEHDPEATDVKEGEVVTWGGVRPSLSASECEELKMINEGMASLRQQWKEEGRHRAQWFQGALSANGARRETPPQTPTPRRASPPNVCVLIPRRKRARPPPKSLTPTPSEYEKLRERNIARNNDILRRLGLLHAEN